jgi:regulator of nonsense transcripts 2
MILVGCSQLTADKESLALAAPLGIAFAKHLGHLYLPAVAASTTSEERSTTDAHDFPTLAEAAEGDPENALVSREVKDKFRKLLIAYLDALGRREGKHHVVRYVVICGA